MNTPSPYKSPATLSDLPLFQHQIEAIRRTISYLNNRAPTDRTCALVQMPTGSGKTGIIAVLSCLCPGIKVTLVLAPRVAIRDQLLREIETEFFKKAGIPAHGRKVGILDKATISDGGESVVIATVQQLDSWRRTNLPAYEALRARLDFVVMDEGHYEPASSWSKSIRELGKPVLLLTATPYRNDLKTFRINPDAISTLRFADATALGVIREVAVESRTSFSSPAGFARDVLIAFNQLVPEKERSNARIIIRCDDASNIRRMCNAFRAEGVEPLGIHEKFEAASTTTPWLRRIVPSPESSTAKVWIHQYKLLEGVDDPSFRVVAIYGDTFNVRALVQQVGRVTRNPSRRPGETAFLLDHHNGELRRMWYQFLEFDGGVTPAQLATPLSERVANTIRDGFSGLEYFDKEFRAPFSFDSITDPTKDFKISREANILRADKEARSSLRSWLEQQLSEGDCAFRFYESEPARIICAYVRATNSRLVTNTYFLETRLGLVIATFDGDLLAFTDTGNLLPINEASAGVYGPPPQSHMSKIIRDGEQCRISDVSTRNSSVARGTVRSRSISAPSILELSPSLDDFQHVVTALIGYSDEPGEPHPIRRYLGYTRGRVSQPGEPVPLEEFLKWTDEVLGRTRSRIKATTLFQRFSQELDKPPADPSPRNILIDFSEARDLFRLAEDGLGNTQIEAQDSCVDCKPSPDSDDKWICTIKVNEIDFEIQVTYDKKRRRYELHSDALNSAYSRTDGRSESLISWLNRTQAFNVIPATHSAIYVHGNFYKPDLKTGPSFDPKEFVLEKILHPVSELKEILSEKGDVCPPDGSGWQRESLFDEIDKLKNNTSVLSPFCDHPESLVCDDLHNEACDFFMAESGRVVMIHAKASRRQRPLSASALQEVTAQASKNAHLINMLSNATPANIRLWTKPWDTGKNKIPQGRVVSRIRLGPATPENTWKLLRERIKDPNSQREVWIVLGGILSKKKYLSELKKASPNPQSIQMTHLLLTCLAAVSAAGARLRIFCMG